MLGATLDEAGVRIVVAFRAEADLLRGCAGTWDGSFRQDLQDGQDFGAANAPGQYEDWHDLDHVQIMQTFSLANYKAIVVAPVTSKGTELPAQSDNSYKPVMDALAGGAASVAIAGAVVDGKTKKVLFSFEPERRSGANSGGLFTPATLARSCHRRTGAGY